MPRRVGLRGNRVRFARGEPVLTLRVGLHYSSRGLEDEFYESLFFEGREPTIPALERLQALVRNDVEEELGSQFTVARLTVGRGSIEVLVAIAAAAEIIANWDDVVRNVGRLLSRLRALFSSRRLLPHPGPPVWVEGDWRPDFDIDQVLLGDNPRVIQAPAVLIWYLVVSNLALSGVLIWLVVTRT